MGLYNMQVPKLAAVVNGCENTCPISHLKFESCLTGVESDGIFY